MITNHHDYQPGDRVRVDGPNDQGTGTIIEPNNPGDHPALPTTYLVRMDNGRLANAHRNYLTPQRVTIRETRR